MRKPEQSSEPSIEEILASIRKIIADDGSLPTARVAATQPTGPDPALFGAGTAMNRRPQQHSGSFYPEPQEVGTGGSDEEILELTEDFMVEDGSAQGREEIAGPDSTEAALHADMMRSRSAGGRAPPSGQELESVLSNVVAEVQRLAAGSNAAAEAPRKKDQDWPDAPAATPSRASWQFPAADRLSPRSEAPQPVDDFAASPSSVVDPEQPRVAAKPAWSARRMPGEGPTAPAPHSRTGKPAAGQPSSRPAMGGREGWAQGVQMPVPESGPATPFPQQNADEADLDPPVSGSGARTPEIEKEKTFVGEMLTRVFKGSAKKAEEPAPAATGPLAKAEELAKITISDFAKEKLRAPTVADALHADKPFMDAITDSLATAIADTEASHAKADESAGMLTPELLDEEDLPESLLPPEEEPGSFGVPPSQAHGLPPAEVPAPLGVPPVAAHQGPPPRRSVESADLPREQPDAMLSEAGQDLRRAHAEMSRLEAEAGLRSPPAPAPRSSAVPPAGEVMSAFPSAAGAAMPLPSGLEDAIKELIKPLIVQWLNDNLPRIVEKAVREELADQGLMNRDRNERGSGR